MAAQSAAMSGKFQHLSLKPLVMTVLTFMLTLLLSIILVTLLLFAQHVFVDKRGMPTHPGLWMYLTNVRTYLQGLLHGNFGKTFNGLQVNSILVVAVRHSLQLLAVSVAVALPIGIAWGSLLVTVQRRWPRIMLDVFSTLALSLPSFVVLLLATQAVATFTQRTHIRLTYVQGYGLDRHLILPVAVLALRGAAFMARSLAVAQLDVLRQDWIRVARAKGLGGLHLWYRHILPALRLPLIGSTLGMLRVMVSGFVIVDYMYEWGGLGRQMLRIDFLNGIVAPESEVAAGATIMLVIFFVATDTLGRLFVTKADPRLRERMNEQ
ncbi:MAG: ABC transporter permease [Herpetosiphonaceae bacterium]|nr:ABC transporter permease [Herpetosiphonaceae bacterium]